MMSVIEKTWVLAYFELKLLVRNRAYLLAVLILPIIGAAFFGLAGHAAYGFFLIFPISSLMVQIHACNGAISQMPARDRSSIGSASSVLTALLVMAGQAILYSVATALVQSKYAPGLAVFVTALIVSLAVGFAACILYRK